jgi:hypothetical protein
MSRPPRLRIFNCSFNHRMRNRPGGHGHRLSLCSSSMAQATPALVRSDLPHLSAVCRMQGFI